MTHEIFYGGRKLGINLEFQQLHNLVNLSNSALLSVLANKRPHALLNTCHKLKTMASGIYNAFRI